jgi:hypothetical protein
MAIRTKRVRTYLGHGTKVASLRDPRCPTLDLTFQCECLSLSYIVVTLEFKKKAKLGYLRTL